MRPLPLRCRRPITRLPCRCLTRSKIHHMAQTQASNQSGTMDTSSPDYKTWSNVDLVKRVSELEQQLRARNDAHSHPHSSSTSPVPPKKKPKKPAKPFDSSRYTTRYIALKFAYLGKNYNGFEHHSNNITPLPTIEEELWKGLRKTRLIFPSFREGQSEDEVCWDGCEYSKCGRTDRGVSAFGQVIGLRVRSNRPKDPSMPEVVYGTHNGERPEASGGDEHSLDNGGLDERPKLDWDPIKDEMPYIQVLNRVLPPDIRILAWCPNPPPGFSARFSCKERRYRYFFTNPAYAPMPGERAGVGNRGSWLDIDAMRIAAKKLEGLHDFRNFCKIDGSKQISNFERRIFHADIKPMTEDQGPLAFLDRLPFALTSATPMSGERERMSMPNMFYLEVHGSAFLWHQVRHMVAVLFLVGQGYEEPSIVDKLVNVQITPSRPVYDMASDTPLVLWDCIFPDPEKPESNDHVVGGMSGYEDGLEWIYAGDLGGADQNIARKSIGTEDRKYGSLSIMENLWSEWRKRKIDEVLAGSLLDVFARQGTQADATRGPDLTTAGNEAVRVFDGSECPRPVGTYVPIMERRRLERPDVVNARYAARKG